MDFYAFFRHKTLIFSFYPCKIWSTKLGENFEPHACLNVKFYPFLLSFFTEKCLLFWNNYPYEEFETMGRYFHVENIRLWCAHLNKKWSIIMEKMTKIGQKMTEIRPKNYIFYSKTEKKPLQILQLNQKSTIQKFYYS